MISKISSEITFINFVEAHDVEDSPTAYRSPWQNPYCERVIGSIRRDLLDHAVIYSQSQVRGLLRGYIDYYNNDRPHLGLGKISPNGRQKCCRNGKIVSIPILNGRHHKYERVSEDKSTEVLSLAS